MTVFFAVLGIRGLPEYRKIGDNDQYGRELMAVQAELL
jgi:hypothetical protein